MRGKRVTPCIVQWLLARIMCHEQELKLVQRYFGSTSRCLENVARWKHGDGIEMEHVSVTIHTGTWLKTILKFWTAKTRIMCHEQELKLEERYFGSTSRYSENHWTTKTRLWNRNGTCFNHDSHRGMIENHTLQSGRRKHGDGTITKLNLFTIHALAPFGRIRKF
jgi:hypothetical protein